MSIFLRRAPVATSRGTGRVILSLTTLMALIMIPASATTNLSGEYQFTATTDPLSILAINNNTTSGSGGIQANSYAAGGKGIYGYSDAPGSAAPGFGVAGISQNGYGVYGSSYGSGITAIFGENLSGGGIGIQGNSSGGTGVVGNGAQNGIQGATTNTSTTLTYSGVYGADNSTSSSVINYGVYGTTANNAGVYGYASGNGIGVVGSGDLGTLGLGGIAGEFGGYYGTAGVPALEAYDAIGGTDLFGTYDYDGSNFPLTFLIQGKSLNNSGDVSTPAAASDVQISGDLYVGGEIYTDCNGTFPATSTSDCGNGPEIAQPTSVGTKVQTYAAEQSMKSVEDFGEAQLVNGQGYVPLDRTYASSIAHDRSYLVFVTAEGDCHGLYVTAKTLNGFTVREFQGGRSTVAFQYRIVAHPYGASAARMATIQSRASTQSARYHLKLNSRMLAMLKTRGRPARPGDHVTRPPHNWVPNLHRR